MNPRTTYQLLWAAATITLIGTSINIFRHMPENAPRAATFWLLTLFGLIVTVAIWYRESVAISRLYLASTTLIILTVFLINEPGVAEASFTLFFILTSCAALLLPTREAVLWIIGTFIAQLAAIAFVYNLETTLGWLSAAGGHVMFAGFGYMMRQSNSARERTEQLYAELQETHAKLQQFTAQSQQLAVAEERNRLAREMHDSLGHRLTVAVLQLEGAQQLINREPERASTMVGNMRDQLKEALAELRRTLSTLRADSEEPPLAVNDATNGSIRTSLIHDVDQLVATFQEATGLKIHTSLPDSLPPLLPPQRLALFRASQELLTNVQRHAVASDAWLELSTDGEVVALTVTDNGTGMPAETDDGRFGLQGLQERAEQLNGQLIVEQPEDGGTRVHFSVGTEPQTSPAPQPALQAA